jgi:hypothetical protein
VETNAAGTVNRLGRGADVDSSPGVRGDAQRVDVGVPQYGVVGRQVSPSSSRSPYDYVLGVPKTDSIPADQTYPASALATIDASYPPTCPRRTFSCATPKLSYEASLVPNRTGQYEGVLSRLLTLKPGEHRAMSWRGGVTVPAPSTTDGIGYDGPTGLGTPNGPGALGPCNRLLDRGLLAQAFE